MCRAYVYAIIGFGLCLFLTSLVFSGRSAVDRAMHGTREALVSGYRKQLVERIARLDAFANATDSKTGLGVGFEILAHHLAVPLIDGFLGTTTSMLCATYDMHRQAGRLLGLELEQ